MKHSHLWVVMRLYFLMCVHCAGMRCTGPVLPFVHNRVQIQILVCSQCTAHPCRSHQVRAASPDAVREAAARHRTSSRGSGPHSERIAAMKYTAKQYIICVFVEITNLYKNQFIIYSTVDHPHLQERCQQPLKACAATGWEANAFKHNVWTSLRNSKLCGPVLNIPKILKKSMQGDQEQMGEPGTGNSSIKIKMKIKTGMHAGQKERAVGWATSHS